MPGPSRGQLFASASFQQGPGVHADDCQFAFCLAAAAERCFGTHALHCVIFVVALLVHWFSNSPPLHSPVAALWLLSVRFKSILAELIPRLTEEDLISGALAVNDDLSRVLLDYEELAKGSTSDAGEPNVDMPYLCQLQIS